MKAYEKFEPLVRRVRECSRMLALLSVFAMLASGSAWSATPADELKVANGFKVELLKSATQDEGSWVCLAVDSKGRLYISPQGKPPGAGVKKEDSWGGLWRATLEATGKLGAFEKVPLPVGDAMGMLWAFNSLYVSGEGPEGRGIYRLRDTDGDDTLDSWTLFKSLPGSDGEHGAHALVLAPDGKSIYMVHGNSTPLVTGIDPNSPYRSYAEDDLLPRVKDPVATFFEKIKAPYGYVVRTDESGSRWELVAGGFRNPYDIDFNTDGELFTFDSDMEWDVGLPWYRPTRVLHVVPGADYGFREGSAKWPDWYPDSLPPVVNVGLGSPTGVKFGTRSNFPDKYRRAFFVMDWTFGRILAVHINPDAKGMRYGAENQLPSQYSLTVPSSSPDVEEFVKGKGLPVTDLEFGKDGAMYFIVGGRNTQAGLYRVSYTGAPPVADPGPLLTGSANTPNSIRRLIEPFQTKTDPGIWEPKQLGGAEIWDLMDGRSRFLGFAARSALEKQPLEQWRTLALSQTDPEIALCALLALARVGTKGDQEAILNRLATFPLDSLSEESKLNKLRVLEVTFARQGRPSHELVQMGVAKLSRQYPAKSFALNRELVQLLVYLTQEPLPGAASPGTHVIENTLALMDQSSEPAEQIWYALCLREASGWTPAQYERYFSWFAKAATYRGGNSLKKYILRIRDLALERAPQENRATFLALAEKPFAPPKEPIAATTRQFVKLWTVADLAPALSQVSKNRDFARGKRLFGEAMCAQCHLFAGTGGTAKAGATGPDLSAVGSRFSARDILEAIIEPSKAISEQYQSLLVTMKDGSTVGGQIAEENQYLLTLVVDPLGGVRQNVLKEDVTKREVSPISLMPPALLATFTQEEVLDLLAYLQSGGNEKATNFGP